MIREEILIYPCRDKVNNQGCSHEEVCVSTGAASISSSCPGMVHVLEIFDAIPEPESNDRVSVLLWRIVSQSDRGYPWFTNPRSKRPRSLSSQECNRSTSRRVQPALGSSISTSHGSCRGLSSVPWIAALTKRVCFPNSRGYASPAQ